MDGGDEDRRRRGRLAPRRTLLAALQSSFPPEPEPRWSSSFTLPHKPASSQSATMVEKGKSRKDEVVTREYTINLHRRLHGCTFKKMAPKSVKEIRKFAQNAMKTSDVRLDVKLNKHLWSRGVRNVPTRVRVRIARKRNDDEDAKEEFYSYVSVAEIPAEGLRNLGTKIVEEDEE